MKSRYIFLYFFIIPFMSNSQIISDFTCLPFNSSVNKISKVNHFLLNIPYDNGNYDCFVPIWIFGDDRIKKLLYFNDGVLQNGSYIYEDVEELNYAYDEFGRLISVKSSIDDNGDFFDLTILYTTNNLIEFNLDSQREPERGYLKLENDLIIEYSREFLSNNGLWYESKKIYSDYDMCGNYTKRKASYEGGAIKDEIISLDYKSLNDCTMTKWQDQFWNYDNENNLIEINGTDLILDSHKRIFRIPNGDTTQYNYLTNGKVGSILVLNERDSIAIEYYDIQSSLDNETYSSIIKTYPNPASQTLNIEIEESILGNFEYGLINYLGQLTKNGTLPTSLNSIDISNIPKGLYILQIQNEEKIFSKKIIIE